ncbi:MAG: S9 family peptidase [Planctomycetes bacterium]|nr:S9 family peptidase [Planctomycetota bacterium]
MPEDRLTPELLWKLPRVGSPVPDQTGARFVVPVTTYDIEKNEGLTRLWLGGDGGLRPITSDTSATSPAWNPNGESVAFLRKTPAGDSAGAEKQQLWLLPLNGGEPRKLTDMPLGASDPKWLPDGRRIAFLSPLHEGHFSIEATAAEVERRKESKVKARTSENRFYRFWDHWICDDPFMHIWLLEVETNQLTDLTPELHKLFPLMDVSGSWDIAPDGSEIAFTAERNDPPYHELTSGVYAVPIAGGEPKLVSEWTTSNAMRPRYSPDGKWLVHGAQAEQGFYADKVRLVAFERASGNHIVLTEPWDYSAGDWEFADNSTLVLLAEDKGANAVYRLDFEHAVNSPGEIDPQQVARGGWYSGLQVRGDRLFTTRQHHRSPPEVFTLKLDGSDEQQRSEFTQPLLSEIPLAEPEEHYFEGAEGRPVQMWLLYPHGKERKNLPLVHMIHGGPHGSFGDQWHWRWCAQAFAAEGYLVAMVNFHGSTGWGNEFARCIMAEWGKKPYEDIAGATDYLVEKGLADPDRMACAGGSYGGYMTAWIATQTDRFKCLVNHAGVSDLQAQYARDVTPGREKALGGEPWGDQEGLDRYNPIRHSKNFKTPMLVIHGEQDYRVPYTQALETYNAYHAQKLEARLVVYPDENHWVLKPQNSLHWYGEVFAWLKRYLG